MLIQSVCIKCFQPFKLIVEPAEIELVKQVSDEMGLTAPCPRLCGGRINLVGSPEGAILEKVKNPPMTVSGKEFYKAVMELAFLMRSQRTQ